MAKNKEELAEQYRIQQYIDFGDLNKKAEEQIEKAFIDGFDEAIKTIDVSTSARQMLIGLNASFTRLAKENVGKKIKDVPELVRLLCAIDVIGAYFS